MFFGFYGLSGANAAVLEQYHAENPNIAQTSPEVVEKVRDWIERNDWTTPSRSALVADPGGESPELLFIPIEMKFVALMLQFFGTHQLMRPIFGIAAFIVFSACCVEPFLVTQPPTAVASLRSILFPTWDVPTRTTNVIMDVSFLFLTGYVAEKYFRNAFAKEINLEMRQAEFMRSPLARLRMTMTTIPPRPLSLAEEAALAPLSAEAAGRVGGGAETAGAGWTMRRRNNAT
jgi:hypothetical protein